MISTLKELQRENARLKVRTESRQEIENIGYERGKLEKENARLRNPLWSNIGKVIVGTGKGIAKGWKKYKAKHEVMPKKKHPILNNLSKLKLSDVI